MTQSELSEGIERGYDLLESMMELQQDIVTWIKASPLQSSEENEQIEELDRFIAEAYGVTWGVIDSYLQGLVDSRRT